MNGDARSVFDFTAKDIDGRDFDLGRLRGQVLLIVNVASECGFTPQYTQLVRLHRAYRDRGFSVLAFPCNQFARQEPADSLGIKMFCAQEFGVDFLMFDKVDVNGTFAHPLFTWLKSQRPGVLFTRSIKWNFTKFLCDANGQPVARYAPSTQPERLTADIEALLRAKDRDDVPRAA